VTGWTILLLGIGLGLRHATDADHVVVVSALVQREPGVWRAARIAALWGLGHTGAFLGLGLLIVVAGVQLPQAFERGAELLVGTMLVAFGLWHVALSRHERTSATTRSSYARPMLIGLVHGLAGSAGIAILAATTIGSRAWAAAYLALFGLGTVLGMVALTVVMSRPIGWLMARDERVRRATTAAAALLSVALGVLVLVDGIG